MTLLNNSFKTMKALKMIKYLIQRLEYLEKLVIDIKYDVITHEQLFKTVQFA